MQFNKSITGKRIRALRERAQLTQADLAKIRNVTQSTIAKQENGERSLGEDGLFWYAKYFSVTTDYLLGLSDVPDNAPKALSDTIPEPITLAAHDTDGEPEVSEERMKEIIKQVYHLIIKNERH